MKLYRRSLRGTFARRFISIGTTLSLHESRRLHSSELQRRCYNGIYKKTHDERLKLSTRVSKNSVKSCRIPIRIKLTLRYRCAVLRIGDLKKLYSEYRKKTRKLLLEGIVV